MSRNLPDWIDGFMSLTENSEPPELYRKWTAISAIASAMMRKIKLELGISITVYPNLYTVLVGPPANGKGTVMGYAYDIVKHIPVIKMTSNATSLQKLISRMKENNLADIDALTGDTVFHSSTTVFSEEFTVFLGYNNRELIAALCDWYDCKEVWSYDTIKRDKEEIRGVWVNLLGGTTPENIQQSFPVEAIGGGLSSRIIFVNEESKAKLVIYPGVTSIKEREIQESLILDLERITLITGTMKLNTKALEFYADWCINNYQKPYLKDKKFAGYNGRRRGHLLTVAMICSMSRSDTLVMELQDLQRAAKFLDEVEAKMGTVFRGIGSSDISALINDAIRMLVLSETDEISLWQFARRFEGDADKFTLDRIIKTLEVSNYIRVIHGGPDKESIIKILPQGERK